MQEDGGLFTLQDLADYKVRIEEPVRTTYKGIEVYKLPFWQQGPAMLQALNILENVDVKAMGYNSPAYMHTVYQAMSLAFADRDFYYGDPYFPPEEPVKGLLSKEYARERAKLIDPARNDPSITPGDPYPFQGGTNPFAQQLASWRNSDFVPADSQPTSGQQDRIVPPTPSAPESDSAFMESFYAGTTSIEAADAEGWVVSITPSGGWVPAVIAGRTGIGLSQRAQSFVTDAKDGPFNVIAPGKRPRVTLTPTLALKDGQPFLSFAVQGGDSQDQNLLQFFLNVVEFGMTVQQAVEAPNLNSYQMRSPFGAPEQFIRCARDDRPVRRHRTATIENGVNPTDRSSAAYRGLVRSASNTGDVADSLFKKGSRARAARPSRSSASLVPPRQRAMRAMATSVPAAAGIDSIRARVRWAAAMSPDAP